jgi:hypothetical protein
MLPFGRDSSTRVAFAYALVHLRRPVEAEKGKACFVPRRRPVHIGAGLVSSNPSRPVHLHWALLR